YLVMGPDGRTEMHRIVLATLILTASFQPARAAEETLMRDSRPGHPSIGAWGVDLTHMDRTIKPGDNFFQYVNGGWFKTAEIKPDRSRAGSFDDLLLLSEFRMREIAEGLAQKSGLSGEERKLRDFYASFVDQRGIDAKGLAP